MPHLIKIFLANLLIYVALLASAQAAEREKFVVTNIEIDEIGDTAELARNNGVLAAKRRAFEIMVGRIFADAGELDFSDEQIEAIVHAIEYRQELITDNRYKALVDVYFAPEQTEFFINNYLLNKPLAKLKVLLVPIYNENGLIKLWQQGNIWFDSWRSAEPSEVIELKLPSGDLNDMINFRVSGLTNLTAEEVKQLEQYYNVDKILLAELEYNYQTIAEEVEFKALLSELGNANNSTLVAKSAGFKSDNYYKHFAYLVERVLANLESGWMEYNSNLEESKKQSFILKIKNIDDWVDARKRIESLELVKSFKVDSFAARYVRITVEFIEKPIEVLEIMKELGFKISREQDNVILYTK